MRVPLVAGNWKMNLNLRQSIDLASEVARGVRADATLAKGVEVAVCPPALYVQAVAEAVQGTLIGVGVQNAYFEARGALTGEISAAMVADVGARFVILGHSERRHTIGRGEDDRMINLKVRAVLSAGLTPILCVGETLAERDAGQTLDVLTFQMKAGLCGCGPGTKSGSSCDASRLVVAYEPVWAIGTGRNASPEQAQEAHAHIRQELRRIVGDGADAVRILYGGSVKPDNAEALFRGADVDGGLIGGASLKADAFLDIARAALRAKG